jgi:dienelactone hydrolase
MTRIGLGAVFAALELAYAPAAKSVEPVGDVSFPAKASLDLSGKLYRPDGGGPFPAIVLMHACGGVEPVQHQVAALLRESGYVALVVDSFSRRYVSTVCDDVDRKSPTYRERVDDALAAQRYLSSLAFVDSSHIGLVGWSHGGITALITWASRNFVEFKPAPFAAIAAYYPYCFKTDALSASGPLLILIGESDDWTPAALCKDFVKNATAHHFDASLTIYPGATHAFDVVDRTVRFDGHVLNPDPSATRESRKRLLEFFEGTLKKKP